MTKPWLIVGAGFTGAVCAERIANVLGKPVLLIDRRPHLAGNAYDYTNDCGILVHKYGPHIFHTNSDKVVDYLSNFTAWQPYEHRVQAVIDGQAVPVPFNLTSLQQCFPEGEAEHLKALLIDAYGMDATVPILKLREAAQDDLRTLADFIYEKVFHNYTTKQWGLTPEQLAPSVTARVPVRISHDDRYFQDTFQHMPADGYTAMFERMLNNDKIKVALGTGYEDVKGAEAYEGVIYTGAIDEYFDYEFGPLAYRSLDFESETLPQERYQSVGTVNYPNDHAYTRITEQKHLTGQQSPKTTIIREYPRPHTAGETEPYYPIPRPENHALYEKYLALARSSNDPLFFAGRLGEYRYYNMDQAVGSALSLFEKRIQGL